MKTLKVLFCLLGLAMVVKGQLGGFTGGNAGIQTGRAVAVNAEGANVRAGPLIAEGASERAAEPIFVDARATTASAILSGNIILYFNFFINLIQFSRFCLFLNKINFFFNIFKLFLKTKPKSRLLYKTACDT